MKPLAFWFNCLHHCSLYSSNRFDYIFVYNNEKISYEQKVSIRKGIIIFVNKDPSIPHSPHNQIKQQFSTFPLTVNSVSIGFQRLKYSSNTN